MPTISGMRRRGYTPEAIRAFCDRIGLAKRENLIDVAALEHAVREHLNAHRAAAHGRPQPAAGGARELPRGPGRGGGRHQQPGGPVGRHAQGAVLAGPLPRARRFPRGPAEEVLPPGARAARCACAARTSSRVSRHGQGPCDRRNRRAAMHLRPGHPRWRRARRPEGQVDAALGVRRPRGARGRAALRPAVQDRDTRGGDGDWKAELNPDSLQVVARRFGSSRRWRGREPGDAPPVRAARLLLRGPRLAARRARLQPHRRPEGPVGEDRAA